MEYLYTYRCGAPAKKIETFGDLGPFNTWQPIVCVNLSTDQTCISRFLQLLLSLIVLMASTRRIVFSLTSASTNILCVTLGQWESQRLLLQLYLSWLPLAAWFTWRIPWFCFQIWVLTLILDLSYNPCLCLTFHSPFLNNVIKICQL